MKRPLSRRRFLSGRFAPGVGSSAPALPTGAPWDAPPRAEKMSLLATISEPSCLAHQGTFCSVCVERCPEPGAIARTEGWPRVVPELCTGCGVCRDVCPAPGNAIVVFPRPRSSRAGGEQ